MKFKPQLCLFLFFICGTASAQVLIGPTAGPQVSWISFGDKDYKDTVSVSPSVGFHVGANLSFRVRKRFFLHTSLVYSTKGRTIKGKIDGALKDEARYSYIEMPMVYTYELKTQVGPGKEFKWYLGAGPNIAYWLSGRGKLYHSGIDEGHGSPIDYKTSFKGDPFSEDQSKLVVTAPNRIQLGLNLAAGVAFEPMGYQKFMLMFRYELGHSNAAKSDGIFPGSEGYYKSNLRSRNQGFRVSLTYLVDLKTETRKKGKSTIKNPGGKKKRRR